MSVSNLIPFNEYAGNDVLLSFNITFPFTLNAHIAVSLINATTLVETAQVEGVDYTLTGDPATAVLFTVEPETGQTVRIYRLTPLTQADSFTTKQTYLTGTLENNLDKVVYTLQELSLKIDRTVRIPNYIDTADFNPSIPLAAFIAGSAGKPLIVNDTEDGLDLGLSAAEISTAVSDAQAAQAAAEAAQAAAEDARDAAGASESAAEDAKDAAEAAQAAAEGSADAAAISETNAAASAALAASSLAIDEINSYASPEILAANDTIIYVDDSTNQRVVIFVRGSAVGDNLLDATEAIEAPSIVGKELWIVGVNSTSYITIPATGTNHILNGPATLQNRSILKLFAVTAALWVEESRNGI